MRCRKVALALTCILVLAACSNDEVRGQAVAVKDIKPGFLEGYLATEELPNSLALLPPPPREGSAAFARDKEASRASLKMRGSARWDQAIKDANLHFPAATDAFSDALGFQVTEKGTPHLYLLLRRALTVALWAAGLPWAPAAEPVPRLAVERQVAIDSEAWRWNWSSWDQEKIFSFGDFQYTAYWDADGVFVLVRRDLRNDEIQTVRLPDFTLASDDRHRNTCLGFSPADGRLHLSWDHHNNQLHYAKSRAGFLTTPSTRLAADDIEPAGPMLSDPKLEARVTYPRFFNNPRGDLFFFYRVGASGNGDNYLHRYHSADGSWTRLGMLFSSQGTYGPWQRSTSRCAYLHDLVFDGRNRLHASWVYREAGATWASNHDLHYAYSDDDGVTWHNNDGRQIADLAAGDPIELADPGIVVREIPVYSWLMNAGCMALDSKNGPHVVTYMSKVVHQPKKLGHGPPPELRGELSFVHYWRSDDGAWRGGTPIDPGPLGTSRVDVVFDADDNLCFFYPTSEGFRYMVARAGDTWSRWSGPHQLTGPGLSGRDASKHDRRRWQQNGLLTFTARSGTAGFAILDAKLGGPKGSR
ncbi:MAG: BNR-4 repeat-containing protein [Planctomycetota bacterium]|jgi:hypothetical protein